MYKLRIIVPDFMLDKIDSQVIVIVLGDDIGL